MATLQVRPKTKNYRAVRYDGTNKAEIAEFTDDAHVVVQGETLVVQTMWQTKFDVETGDYVIETAKCTMGVFPTFEVLNPTEFAERFTVVGR